MKSMTFVEWLHQDIKCLTRPRKLLRMKTYDRGEALVNIDNVAEAIATIEGEDFK
jgi:hypothetical protein